MNDKTTATLAHMLVNLGFEPPHYQKPKWYQFRLKQKLAYYDQHNWPYKIVAAQKEVE